MQTAPSVPSVPSTPSTPSTASGRKQHHNSRPPRHGDRSGKAPTMPRIFSDCRRLLDILIDATPNFPREFKYTIGQLLVNGAVTLMGLSAKAYVATDKSVKKDRLRAFAEEYVVMRELAKVAMERRWMSVGKSAMIMERLVSIDTQAEAWAASLQPEREGQG